MNVNVGKAPQRSLSFNAPKIPSETKKNIEGNHMNRFLLNGTYAKLFRWRENREVKPSATVFKPNKISIHSLAASF
jgi:hypothetical protein